MGSWRPTQGAQTVSLRPLTKGMFLNKAGPQVPVGGFLNAEGCIIDPRGPRRRPGFFTVALDGQVSGNANRMFHRYLLDGNRYEYVATSDFLYKFDYTAGLTLIPFKYDTGTVASSDGDTITGTSTAWTTSTDIPNVKAGDYFKLAADADDKLTKIASVVNATEITLDSTYHNTDFGDPTPVEYEIYRVFGVEDEHSMIDLVVTAERAVLFSTELPPVEINSTNDELIYLQTSAGADATLASKYFTAKVGAFFKERLWFGHVQEWDGTSAFEDNRQRVRYSTATNIGNLESYNYIDFTYTGGTVNAIVPMGNVLAVYLDDAVYVGYPTSQYNIPLQFDAIETGGRGLVGTKAVVPFREGHLAVFQDNIYYVTPKGLEPIGDPIIRKTLKLCKNRWRIQAVLDPRRNRVCFGFPLDNEYIETVYSFQYQTMAWSHEDYETWMIANPRIDRALSWDGLASPATTWDELDDISTTWDDLSSTWITNDFVREYNNYLQVAGQEVTADSIEGAISMVLESGDIDLSKSEALKCFTRLAVKLEFVDDTPLTSDLEFDVEVSHNRGRQWKSVGTITIAAGEDEGYVNYRLTSSHQRFRLTSTSEVPSYIVTEISFRVAMRGKEGSLATQENA